MKIQKVKKGILPVLLIAALYGIPFCVKNQYMLRIGVYVCIYSILACSLNLISGVCGQVSMGHAAFYGIGAYASALVAIHFGINWVVCVIAAAIAAGVIGVLIGIPALKLSGGYLVICTVGFGELVRLILLNWVSLTRGPMGLVNIPRPVLFGVTIKSGSQYMVVALTLFLLIYLILHNILNSKYGRNLKAIREDEIAAETMGIHVHREKVIAFAIAAAMAGAAGSLLAHYMLFISPTIFVGDFSTNILSMVVLGGMGFMPGSVIAATLLTVIPETLRGLDKYRMLIYGFLLIGLMLGKNVSWETTALGRWGAGIWGKIRQRRGLKEGDGKV
ncbi:MAG: branched-chain amino acid ABC transporter permease [Lachnospiraceae bacterium]|nr:branched-chain amino acid ABC transporter permease [Lachnospiraceae bacterium]